MIAATLAWLRSRLLLPPEASDARAARAEAEALRCRLLDRAGMQAAADWLEHRPQLGREVFARGRAEVQAGERNADVTDLLRACLVALRLPANAVAVLPHGRVPLWRMTDAVRCIRAMLAGAQEDGTKLGVFLPVIGANADDSSLHSRAALASTFGAALELAREGVVMVEQAEAFGTVQVRLGQE